MRVGVSDISMPVASLMWFVICKVHYSQDDWRASGPLPMHKSPSSYLVRQHNWAEWPTFIPSKMHIFSPILGICDVPKLSFDRSFASDHFQSCWILAWLLICSLVIENYHIWYCCGIYIFWLSTSDHKHRVLVDGKSTLDERRSHSCAYTISADNDKCAHYMESLYGLK